VPIPPTAAAADAAHLPAGYRLSAFGEIDSTNDEGLRRLHQGAGHGEVIWARTQNAGRGRRGGAWESPAGNLHASIVVALPQHGDIGQIAFVAALGVGTAIDGIAPSGADLRYKWPNDVLIDGSKVAGILIEADLPVGGAARAVVGIGVNLAQAPTLAGHPATSLCAAGAAEVSPQAFLGPLCHGFEHWFQCWLAEGFRPVRAAWLARAAGIGAAIEARLARETLHGRFRGIDESGALVLAVAGGGRRVIHAAEVFFRAA
jgi:BirA family biotin operon repressor/biotin-[acetyl-CoA-carboxylase] ligase